MYKPKSLSARFRQKDINTNQNNDQQLEPPTEGTKHLKPEEMKEALTKIALEVQRYTWRNQTVDIAEVVNILTLKRSLGFYSGVEPSEDFVDEVSMYKSKLNMKKKLIKNLKVNLNTACVVAKTLTSSKEKECLALNKHLTDAQNENLALQKQNSEQLDMIQKLKLENHVLLTKFEQLKHFIDLGYKELQQIRNQPVTENTSLELCLKEILVSCGQFYADYRNEQEKNGQLDQKNRFLTTKLSIMERDFETAMEHLRQCGKTNCKFPCKAVVKRKMGNVNSELNLRKFNDYHGGMEVGKHPNGDMDLSAHMSLVKDLLCDQDSLLGELKMISKEVQRLNS